MQPTSITQKKPLQYRWQIVGGCAAVALLSFSIFLYYSTRTVLACAQSGAEPSTSAMFASIIPLITGLLSTTGGIAGLFARVTSLLPDGEVKNVAVKLLPVGRISEIKHTFDSSTTKEERDACRSLAEIAVKTLMIEWFPPDKATA